jgi:hypothetical protein
MLPVSHFFQRQLICVLLSWPSNTRVVPVSAPSSFYVCGKLVCVLFSWPNLTRVLFISTYSLSFSMTIYMCLIIITQSHMSTTCISAQLFFLGTTYMCIIIMASYQRPVIFFPMTTNLHAYTDHHPVTNRYVVWQPFFPAITYMRIIYDRE